MTPRCFTLSAALLALTLGCAAESDESEITELPAATILVRDAELHGVKDLRPIEDGGLLVLARYSPYLRWYDRDGRLLCAGGYAGNGPGEFRYPWAFVRQAPAPTVSDPSLRRLTTVRGCQDPPSLLRFPDVVPDARSDLPNLTYGDAFQVGYSAGGFTASRFPAPINQASGFLGATLVRVSASGVLGDTIINFRNVPGREEVIRSALWLIPVPLWDVCPEGELISHDGVSAQLVTWSPRGGLPTRVPLPGHLIPRRELSDQEVQLHVRHWLVLEALEYQRDTSTVDADTQEFLSRARSVFGTTAPGVTRIRCDDRSRVWLQEFDLYDNPIGMSARWTILDGPTVRRVRFPTEFRLMAIQGDRAFGVVVDAYGEETVAAVPIP